jgi:molybdate transport system substrate-binding protein
VRTSVGVGGAVGRGGRVLALATAVAFALSSCSSSEHAAVTVPRGALSGPSAAQLHGTIEVFAASSLQEAFTSLGQSFEKAHPGVHVRFNFGASSALAQQIDQGAPADVFASAATTNMTQVVQAGHATGPSNFVKNGMEIAVPPSNPGHVRELSDLARAGVIVALCQAQVPCGATANKVFANAKLTVHPVTLEPDVKSTLAKVELGAVDAGVVYVTDVRAAGSKVLGIPIPDAVNASTEYPIAALTSAANTAGAQAFVAYVRSDAGRAVLSSDGFEQP